MYATKPLINWRYNKKFGMRECRAEHSWIRKLETINNTVKHFYNIKFIPFPPIQIYSCNIPFFCVKGFDGGQGHTTFILETYDQHTGILQANVSSKYPIFNVGGLDANRLLKILIYATNVRGKSEVVVLEAYTLKVAEKQTG